MPCDPGFYQVISGQLGELNPGAQTYETIGQDQASYNAMAYRVVDGYMYAIRGSDLLRVNAAGDIVNLGTLSIPSGSYAGDFGDDGLLHVSRGGRDWHTIDVDTLAATPIAAWSQYTAVADITNVHGVFYGVSSDGALFAYDQADYSTTEIGPVAGLPTTLKAYGAAWATAGGNFYVGRNSGEIYQITGYTTSEPQATQVGSSPATSSNDGASCALAAPPAGLDDVDGPISESAPSTPEAQAAAQVYEENYDEISAGFEPAGPPDIPEEPSEPTTGNGKTYELENAGIGQGASCSNVVEDQPARQAYVVMGEVVVETTVYTSAFNGDALSSFEILSGSWIEEDGQFRQLNTCDYDLTALLRSEAVENFRWEADMVGLADTNHGGLVFNQSSSDSRSGAMLVDLHGGGDTLRWGYYDDAGYYVNLGSAELGRANPAGSIRLGVEVHGADVRIFADGIEIAATQAPRVGGYVGLASSASSVGFDNASLVALPPTANEGQNS